MRIKIFQYGTFSELEVVENEVNEFAKGKDVIKITATSTFDDRVRDAMFQILVVYKGVNE